MNNKVRSAITLLIASAIAISFSLILAIINDQLFLQTLQEQQALDFIRKQSLSFYLAGNPTVNVHIEWPWYSLLFFYGVMCVFWFFMGKKLTNYLSQKSKMLGLVVPFVHTAILGELIFPLYFLCCYLGLKRN